jgi:mitochondrial fission protein ELM1
VIQTIAAPNRITAQKLDRARSDFASDFAMLGGPRVAVLIGGNSKAHRMTTYIMEKLGIQLSNISGSLMITASRRTGDVEKNALIRGLGDRDYYFWDGTGENPYFGMLAWADVILVTADSVSMLGDAATTGKPVYVIEMEGGTPRFDKFHRILREKGIVRPFDGILEHWTYPPLNDAGRIAREIERRMARR